MSYLGRLLPTWAGGDSPAVVHADTPDMTAMPFPTRSAISNAPVGASVGLGTSGSAISNAPVGASVGLGTSGSAITNAPVGATIGLGTSGSAITNAPVGVTIGLGLGESAIRSKPVGSTIGIEQVIPTEVRSPEVKGVDPPPQPVINPTVIDPKIINSTTSSASLKSVKNLLGEWIKPNPLNKYWQATYHFQLFILDDLGFKGSKNIDQVLEKVKGNEINQVIIAESGVTGYNIRDVEINTVNSFNGKTLNQKATFLTMTVVEPMGVTFLDAIYHSASLLNVWDYTKMVYYLKLTFTGYNEDGTFAHNPIPLGYPNGGQWIWALEVMDIDTKVNEGGGVYTLRFVHVETQALLTESNKLAVKNIIKAEGADLKTLFADYSKKFNDAYAEDHGKDPDGKFVLSIKIVADHPMLFGDTDKGKKPESFKLTNEKADEQSIRALTLDSKGGKTGTAANEVPPGMTVNQFITAAILSTEEGQKMVKDVPITGEAEKNTASKTTPEVRISKLFSVEPVIDLNGVDETSGKYVKEITFHIVPTTSQEAIITRKDANDYYSAEGQLRYVNDLCTNGFLQKRYDYIFTGLNTEVIDFDIHFKMSYMAPVPRRGGTRVSILNNATHTSFNRNNPDSQAKVITGAKVETPPIKPTSTGYQPTFLQGVGDTIGDAATAAGRFLGIGPAVPKPVIDMTQQTEAGHHAGKAEAERLAKLEIAGREARILKLAQAQNIGKIYVEDVLTNINQGRMGGVINKKTRLPITFSQGYLDIDATAKTVTNPQVHIDRPVAGAVYAQLHENTMTEAFMNIDLTIRGDPFWLGQGNIERQMVLSAKNADGSSAGLTHEATGLPNGSSGDHCIYLHFLNPLQMGDDFKPVLSEKLVFNNLYAINTVKHTFAEGQFKQVLTGTILPKINIGLAMTADPNAVNNGPASPQAANAQPDAGSVNATADTQTNTNTPGSAASKIAPSGSLPNSKNQQDLAKESYDYWRGKGYSPAASSGMVAQEEAESHFGTDPNTNRPGIAAGNFQWSPPRAAAIKAGTGIDVGDPNLSHTQQLAAAHWELNGVEKRAGDLIRAAPDGGAAGSVAAVKYERPRDLTGAAQKRGGRGAFWQQQFG